MKPKIMRIRQMQTVGHYRPATKMTLPGQFNKPRRGRPGKAMPSMKRLGAKVRRGR